MQNKKKVPFFSRLKNLQKSAEQRLGIRHRLMLSFSLLLIFMLLVLWLTQVVFLDEIYKSIKSRDLSATADKIAHIPVAAGEESFTKALEEISASGEACVLILSFRENQYAPSVLYQTPVESALHANCLIHANLTNRDLYNLYQQSIAAGEQESTLRYMYDIKTRTFFNVEGGLFADPPAEAEGLPEGLLLTRPLVTEDGMYALFLNATLSPVSATKNAIHSILIILSVLLLFVGFIFSYFLSKRLSAPIVEMTKDAQNLAAWHETASFHAHGYKEAIDLADALTRARGELAKSALLRRELIANVSHDLRTPVTLIAGYSEMIRDIPGENNPENAQILLDEATRLSALINDLLDLSKMEAGTGEVEPETFALTEVLQSAMARYDKLHPDHTIRFEAADSVTITSDRTRVLQIVYNLVNNAINHVGSDNMVLVTQTLPPPDANGRTWVRISVTDHGTGIPKDQIDLIWDRYYKVDKNRRRATVGTGLGLSIVRSTTQLLGGRGGVSSTEGKGSTFWFELPLNL